MAKKDIKNLSESEMDKKVRDLKLELLKQPTKRKSIKKEIARVLSQKTKLKLDLIKSNKEKK